MRIATEPDSDSIAPSNGIALVSKTLNHEKPYIIFHWLNA